MRSTPDVSKSLWDGIRTTFSNVNLANKTLLRTIIGSVLIAGVLIVFQFFIGKSLGPLLLGTISILLGFVIILPFIWVEIRQLFQL